MGVLSVFAVLWSAVTTWSWSRRSGKIAVDHLSLVKLVVVTCGNLAHVFLAVVFFASLYWFTFFKYQSYLHVMLPSPEQELLIKHYVIAIFALKVQHARLTFCKKKMSKHIFLSQNKCVISIFDLTDCIHCLFCITTRPNILLFKSLCRSTFLNYIKFVDRYI